MTDDELTSTLREWEAPRAPETLRRRVLPKSRFPFRGLFGGQMRFALPATLAVLCLLILGAYRWSRPPAPSTLSNFQHVASFQPRIVRTTYENR